MTAPGLLGQRQSAQHGLRRRATEVEAARVGEGMEEGEEVAHLLVRQLLIGVNIMERPF